MTSKLSSVQYGFTQNRSILTNLIIAKHDIADAFNEHEPMDIIAFDFSRAFDWVPHHLLLQELARHNISGSALDWISSSLKGRTQSVKVGSLVSPCIRKLWHVHGSTLEPALWIIFMESLLVPWTPWLLAFADDLKFIARLIKYKVDSI